jgi:hypothetical protein
MAEAWNICDDYLEPLARMLLKWGARHLDRLGFDRWPTGLDYPGPIPPVQPDNRTECLLSFLKVAHEQTIRLAQIWLQVNVSMEMADHVTNLVNEAMKSILAAEKASRWPDTVKAGWYLLDLSRVIHQRQGHQIAKADLQQDTDAFHGPFTVDELTNGKHGKRGLLRVSKRTFYRRMKEHGAMFKPVGNLYYVHRSLLPDDD